MAKLNSTAGENKSQQQSDYFFMTAIKRKAYNKKICSFPSLITETTIIIILADAN